MHIPVKPYVVRLYLGALGFFLVNKFVVRPLTLHSALPRWVEVVVYSSPNLMEAIVGMTVIAVLLLLARRRYPRFRAWTSELTVYALTAGLAGTFVLTQEFKLHDLGGRNVYDPWDAVASAVGVVVMWAVFSHFGVLKPVPSRGRPSDAGGAAGY